MNADLLLMSSALILAGTLEAYLERVAGVEFMETHAMLFPYLAARTLGGLIFAASGLLLA